MPGFVGAIKVNSVSSSAVFHVGDAYYIQPISSAKTYAGGGSFNTGNGINVQLGQSETIVFDRDVID
ncbi:spore germination protein [Filobacillus milosensis]|uniref:Spore germination protein n=1 Tax=Filobacillus milosensis TaxID=94137 RepID=A0A4Y8INU1_9BACI|nr:spore germination protein [Filobacillus milosensis]TFB22054.1 spore germination protein [Filobacillus milosensis]